MLVMQWSRRLVVPYYIVVFVPRRVMLFMFVLATLVGYFMYYFYQPKTDKTSLDPRLGRKPRKNGYFRSSILCQSQEFHSFAAFRDSFTTFQSVSEAVRYNFYLGTSLLTGPNQVGLDWSVDLGERLP